MINVNGLIFQFFGERLTKSAISKVLNHLHTKGNLPRNFPLDRFNLFGGVMEQTNRQTDILLLHYKDCEELRI